MASHKGTNPITAPMAKRQMGSDLHCYKSQARYTHVSGVVVNRSDAWWILVLPTTAPYLSSTRRRLECVGMRRYISSPANSTPFALDCCSEPKEGAEIAGPNKDASEAGRDLDDLNKLLTCRCNRAGQSIPAYDSRDSRHLQARRQRDGTAQPPS
ncbi:hypothetical protein VTN77DRAFT_7950 [Rasamsonia byssochlamydoides]|uniref:uncharacterized protein n=1 Tax=Rasamsonia byssochlamydoides TaxID=89139 RepID=UPI003741FF09